MANTFKISTLIQNVNDGRGTNRKVVHRIPAFDRALSGYASCVLELTGTGTHTLINDSSTFNYNSGTILKDPITGADVEITDDTIYGWAIVCDRAAAATAPTGYVRITNSGFCAWATDGTLRMHEDSIFVFHNPGSQATGDTFGLTIELGLGTGYKVSVLVWCK